MSRRRVVVTGLGIISPVGNDVSTAWNNIVAGRSGIRKIDLFDVSPFSSQIGGTIIDFDPTAYIPLKDVKKMDPFVQYGMAAGIQAIEDSGFEVTEANAHRIGVNISSGIGGIGTIERAEQIYSQSGPRKISPFFVPSCIINMVSGNLSIRYGLKGPNLTVVTACATGTHSLGLGARMIQYGDADIMVVGGAEMAMTPTGAEVFPPRAHYPVAMMIRKEPAVRGIATATVLFWLLVQVCSFSKSMRWHASVAPRSTLRWLVSG